MKRRIHLSVLFGLICAILLSMSHFNVLCEDLRHNVLRLHIIANSDSVADQQLKLKIRDEILAQTGDMFLGITDLATAEDKAQNSLKDFELIANGVIKESGFDYKATAYLGDSYFETRHYDDFSLPAGNYRSLIINLGESKGKNWWCVIFPTVCIPAATDGDLTDSVAVESANVAKNANRYVIKFKTVEIYEKIKKFVNK